MSHALAVSGVPRDLLSLQEHVATAPDGHTTDTASLGCVGTGRLVLTSRTLHLNTTEELGSIRLIVGYNWGHCSRYVSAQIITCMYCVVSAAFLLLLNEIPSCADFVVSVFVVVVLMLLFYVCLLLLFLDGLEGSCCLFYVVGIVLVFLSFFLSFISVLCWFFVCLFWFLLLLLFFTRAILVEFCIFD